MTSLPLPLPLPGPGAWPRPQLHLKADLHAGASRRVLLVDGPDQSIVEVRLVLRPDLDRVTAPGMAVLACLGKPGSALDPGEIARTLSAVGGSVSRSVIGGAIVLSAFGPAGSGPILARLLVLIAGVPTRESATAALTTVAAQIAAVDPRLAADRMGIALLRPGVSFATEHMVASADPESVVAAADVFARGSVALVVVGDVEESSLIYTLGPPGACPADLARRARSVSARVLLLDKPGAGQVDLFAMAEAPAPATTERAAAEIAVRLLGGGATSRLSTRLREQDGLAYSANSAWNDSPHGSLVVSSAAVAPANAAAAAASFREEIAGLSTRPLSDADVAAAARGLLGRIAIDLSTPAGIADRVAATLVAGADPGSVVAGVEGAQRLTPTQIASVADRWLLVESHTILLVGDAEAVRASFGDAVQIENAGESLGWVR